MAEKGQQGMYAGVPYQVVEKDGKLYISLQASDAAWFIGKGAKMTLLDDIGEKDPEDLMAELFDSFED